MTHCYKSIPAVLVLFYALCMVCPERVLPALALRTAEDSEPHDCHNGTKHEAESDCRTAFAESLPSQPVKFLHASIVHALQFPPDLLSRPADLLLRLRTTHFSTAGPPLAALTINLRI
jgi:hypothetical protein